MTTEQEACIESMRILADKFPRYILKVVYPSGYAAANNFEGDNFAVSGDGLVDCIFRIEPEGFKLVFGSSSYFNKFCRERPQDIYTPSQLLGMFSEFLYNEKLKYEQELEKLRAMGILVFRD